MPREYPLHVWTVDHPGSTPPITKQTRVVDDIHGVRRVRIPGPFEIPERTARTLVATVINPVTIRLAYVIGREQRGTTRTTVDKRRFQCGLHITCGSHTADGIVNHEDSVELAPEPDVAHIPGEVLALGVQPLAELPHPIGRLDQGEMKTQLEM